MQEIAPEIVEITPDVTPEITPDPVVVLSNNEQEAKEFIYFKESSNNPYAVNPESGSCGLGQRLPCETLKQECPDLNADCQDQHFTRYAISRYGSWVNAKAWWLQHKWW